MWQNSGIIYPVSPALPGEPEGGRRSAGVRAPHPHCHRRRADHRQAAAGQVLGPVCRAGGQLP